MDIKKALFFLIFVNVLYVYGFNNVRLIDKYNICHENCNVASIDNTIKIESIL